MAIVTLAELTWWAAAHSAGIAPSPMISTYLLLTFCGLAAALALRLVLRRKAPWPSALSVIAGTLLVALGASLFLPLKYSIPNEVPFWLDLPLADAERGLFGIDPWLMMDHAIGWALVPMDRLYGLWLPTQLLVLFTLIMEAPSAAKSRSLIAYSMAWLVLGVVAAVLLSSAGPLFYDRVFDSRAFASLRVNLQAGGASMVLAESDTMWTAFASGDPGLVAGISAMPSIHVAISVWIFLTARILAPRLANWALVYSVIIWMGSIQLGWHYATDGLAGALGMMLIWALAGKVSSAFNRRPGFLPRGNES